MRARNKIEADILAVQNKIRETQEFKAISSSAVAEPLLQLYTKCRDYYIKTIQQLDESSPDLNREYAKHKACLTLVNSFISSMNDSDARIEALIKELAELNTELGEFIEHAKQLEKNRF